MCNYFPVESLVFILVSALTKLRQILKRSLTHDDFASRFLNSSKPIS